MEKEDGGSRMEDVGIDYQAEGEKSLKWLY